jgi:hypothetical protein
MFGEQRRISMNETLPQLSPNEYLVMTDATVETPNMEPGITLEPAEEQGVVKPGFDPPGNQGRLGERGKEISGIVAPEFSPPKVVSIAISETELVAPEELPP